jgi:hypothetical protein
MKGDISRSTFDPARQYRRVLDQQGRVQIDATANERQDLLAYHEEIRGHDIVGPGGFPKPTAGGGFAIGLSTDGKDLTISPGRGYVDGILCQLHPTEVPMAVVGATEVAVDRWTIDGREPSPGDWVELVHDATPVVRRWGEPDAGDAFSAPVQVAAVDAATRRLTLASLPAGLAVGQQGRLRRSPTYAAQPSYFPSSPFGADGPLADGRYRVYMDVCEIHRTQQDHPHLREPALGGADSATRTQVVWQVKLELLAPGDPTDCSSFSANWTPRNAVGTGTLRARAFVDPSAAGPCILPPDALYQGPEHQLYRVEIHDGGNTSSATVTFKVQRDNGSVVTRFETIGQTAVLHDLGRDETLGFRQGDAVEALDDRAELTGVPGDLLKIVDPVDPTTRTIRLDHAPTLPTGLDTAHNARLRRWDQVGAVTPAVDLANDWITVDPGSGLQVQFSNGLYEKDGYWLIPARAASGGLGGDIEWERDDDGEPLFQLPKGVKHHWAPLAMVSVAGGRFVDTSSEPLLDCRKLFPSLTAIQATDVAYDNSVCSLPGVTNVQQALDAICRERGGVCTVTVFPGDGWEHALGEIPATAEGRKDVEICFAVGEFRLDRPIVLSGLGHVRLEGRGLGTRIRALRSEAALVFRDCESVSITDLYVEGGTTGEGDAPGRGRFTGALTFLDCPTVDVERVGVTSSIGPTGRSACVKVSNQESTSFRPNPASVVGSVRIRHNDLLVGHRQAGILVSNVARIQIEDNTVRTRQDQPVRAAEELKDAEARRLLARRLLAGISTTSARAVHPILPGNRRVVASVAVRTIKVFFDTERELATAWQGVVNALSQSVDIRTPTALKQLLERASHLLVQDPARVPESAAFRAFLARMLAGRVEPTAEQGIVIGGVTARDVRIVNNTVEHATQAIHVGVSRPDPRRSARDQLARLLKSGNTVEIALKRQTLGTRHGIIGGNSQSVTVKDNRLTGRQLDDDAPRQIDGIRAYGYLGPMVVIQHNHLEGFSSGVVAHRVGGWTLPQVWLVDPNLVLSL